MGTHRAGLNKLLFISATAVLASCDDSPGTDTGDDTNNWNMYRGPAE
jgi:hypothetical protein